MNARQHATVLGLRWPCTRAELEIAFRAQTFRWHPDRCSDPDALRRMQDINAARAALLGVLESAIPAPRERRARRRPNPASDGRTGIRCPLTGVVIVDEHGRDEDGLVVCDDPLRRIFARQFVSLMYPKVQTVSMMPWFSLQGIEWTGIKRLSFVLGSLFGGRRARGLPVEQHRFGAIVGQHRDLPASLDEDAAFAAQCGAHGFVADPPVANDRFSHLVVVTGTSEIAKRIADRMRAERWTVRKSFGSEV